MKNQMYLHNIKGPSSISAGVHWSTRLKFVQKFKPVLKWFLGVCREFIYTDCTVHVTYTTVNFPLFCVLPNNDPTEFDIHRPMHRNIISVVKPTRLYIQLSNGYWCLLSSMQTAVSVWHMPVAVFTVLNCWWWTERPSETCSVIPK